MTVIIDKNGIQHIVDHDACVRIDKGERFPLGDSVPLNILVGVYHQSLYHSKKEDPRHDSVCQRLEALEKQIGAFPPRTLYERQVVYRAENLKSYSKLIAEIEALQKKVKALGDQHREPDLEKYECIDLGTGGNIYVPKRTNCG